MILRLRSNKQEQKTTLVLSNTREFNRVPSINYSILYILGMLVHTMLNLVYLKAYILSIRLVYCYKMRVWTDFR